MRAAVLLDFVVLLLCSTRFACSQCFHLRQEDAAHRARLVRGPGGGGHHDDHGHHDGDYSEGGANKTVVSFCPQRCECSIAIGNQLQVICDGHFDQDFPLESLRRDVEILKITPKCESAVATVKSASGSAKACKRKPNRLVLGPNIQELRLLKTLSITDSSVPNMGARTLWGLSGLRTLDLSRNLLTTAVERNFEGLHSLRELYLDDNSIRSVVSAAFRHLTQLEMLSIRNNGIEDLAPRIFFKLSRLRYLDLSGNRLGHVDGSIFVDIPALETFACENCGLFKISMPEQVSMSKLHSLFLSNNTIQRLCDVSAGMLARLETFDLSSNRLNTWGNSSDHNGDGTLTTCSSDKSFLDRMKTLNVARNNISAVSDCAFCNMPQLHSLDLAHNRIGEINVAMLPKEAHSLLSLSLSGNWVTLPSLTSLLSRLSALEALAIDHTGIVSVPNSLLLANHALRHLNLSRNLLVDLEVSTFHHLERLETLDLSSNFIMGMSLSFFQEVERKKRLKMVYLQNNPWKCDRCHIRPLIHFLKNSLMYWGSCFSPSGSSSAAGPLCLRCSRPTTLTGVPVEELADADALPDCEQPSELVRSQAGGAAGGGREGGASPRGLDLNGLAWDTNSPYAVVAVVAAIVVVLVIAIALKYRHSGVYRTREDSTLVDGEDELLENPVIVLDRNAESYVNLRYPVSPELDISSCSSNSIKAIKH